MHEAQPRKLGGALAKDLGSNRHLMAPENDVLGLGDSLFEQRWRDRALVDIEERNVVIGGLMKKDDELDEVGVGLLPERLLATAKEIIEERGDVVSERVGVEIVVKRVVAVLGVETDFDVILDALVTREDVFHLAAKIALYLKDQSADTLLFIGGFVSQDLLRKRKHAATGLTAANSAQDSDSREQTALGNREPIGFFSGHRLARGMHLSH